VEELKKVNLVKEGSDSCPICEFEITSYKKFGVRFSLVRYLEGYLTVVACIKWFKRSCVNHAVAVVAKD
jgi:hypothetical protein